MHIVVILLLLVAPMALAVVGDLLFHAAPCPRLVGFHLRAPVWCGLWLHAAHDSPVCRTRRHPVSLSPAGRRRRIPWVVPGAACEVGEVTSDWGPISRRAGDGAA